MKIKNSTDNCSVKDRIVYPFENGTRITALCYRSINPNMTTLSIYTHEFQDAQARTSDIVANALDFSKKKESAVMIQQTQSYAMGREDKIMGK